MSYKVVVPDEISQTIRQFGLGRSLGIRLFTAVHEEIPANYASSRRFRDPQDETVYRHRIVLADGDLRHVFIFAVDDTTAQGSLIVVGVNHEVR